MVRERAIFSLFFLVKSHNLPSDISIIEIVCAFDKEQEKDLHAFVVLSKARGLKGSLLLLMLGAIVREHYAIKLKCEISIFLLHGIFMNLFTDRPEFDRIALNNLGKGIKVGGHIL